jgi:multisubunit Na+/H+ antiporter MnhG subunit
MANSNGPVIDMTPDGAFIEPPKPTIGTILLRLAAFAVFLGAIALAFWVAVLLLPIVLILGVAGYFVLRAQLRRGGVRVMRFR